MYVHADYSNFRYAPTSDSEFNICGQLPVGLQVQVLEVIEPYENSYNSSIRWARIAYSSDVSRYITNNSCFHSSQDFYVAHGYLRR